MGLLQDASLADFYTTDLHAINPLLEAMGQRGMSVDPTVRASLAAELHTKLAETLTRLRALIPPECCPTKIYKRQPVPALDTFVVTHTVIQRYCTYCTVARPNKRHTCFKTHPALAHVGERVVDVPQWVRSLPFVPSPNGLLTYIKHKGYALPSKYNRKTGERRETSDEAALLRLALTTEDPVLAAVLEYRD